MLQKKVWDFFQSPFMEQFRHIIGVYFIYECFYIVRSTNITRLGLHCQTSLRSYPLTLNPRPISLIPNPYSLSPSTVPLKIFRWGLFLWLFCDCSFRPYHRIRELSFCQLETDLTRSFLKQVFHFWGAWSFSLAIQLRSIFFFSKTWFCVQ